MRVHNYSLDTAATNVPVRFLAVARDANDENNVGAPLKLGTVTIPAIPALGWQPASFDWVTSGMAPTGAQLYRIFVIVAQNDPGKGAADPWNRRRPRLGRPLRRPRHRGRHQVRLTLTA